MDGIGKEKKFTGYDLDMQYYFHHRLIIIGLPQFE